jgi:polysaccharide pyruvyl transferase WcaK-like protein
MAISQEKSRDDGPIRICLYCCIPQSKEDLQIEMTGLQRAKRVLRRQIDDWTLRTSGKLIARFFDYNDTSGSNRGDIALRRQTQNLISQALQPRQIAWMEIGWGELSAEAIAKINNESDFFVIGAGGYIHFGLASADLAAARAFENDVRLIEQLQIPVISFAIGSNLIFSQSNQTLRIAESTKRALREFYKKTAKASVRELSTVSAIAAADIEKNVRLVPDPVLYLRGSSGSRRQQSPRIGLNLAFSGHMTQRLLQTSIDQIARAISRAAREHQATIVYFVHDGAEQGIPRWLKRFGVKCEVVDADPKGLADAYSDLTVHVGSMMHSSVLAMAQDIPTIGLAYGTKHVALFDLMQQSDYLLLLPGITSEQLTAKINDALANRDAITSQIAKRRAALRPALDAAVEDIANLVIAAQRSAQQRLFKQVGVG